MKPYPNEFKYIGGGWYQVIEYPIWPSKGVRHLSKVHGKKNLPPKVDGPYNNYYDEFIDNLFK